jgi:succinyl-diaminopimelate desuccinylase
MKLEEYLTKLVGYQTVTGDEYEIGQCLDWLEQFFSDNFMYTHRLERNGVENLVATTQPTTKPKILLQAHIDVAPAEQRQFQLQTKNGKYYGRGVFDMKYALALFMQVTDELAKDISKYDYGVMISSDEEIGGKDGANFLLEEDWSTEFCILPDGGDDWGIEASSKGFWQLNATAYGRSAHGSRPWEGVNAINKLIDFLKEIEKFFENSNGDSTTLNVGLIEGGLAFNQVPDMATAQLDIRTPDKPSHNRIYKQVRSVAEKKGIELEKLFSGAPRITDFNDKYITSFLDITQKVLDKSPEPRKSYGSSDGRFFTDKNIPVAIMRPSGGDAHGPEEWVRKSDLPKYKKIVRQFIETHARIS